MLHCLIPYRTRVYGAHLGPYVSRYAWFEYEFLNRARPGGALNIGHIFLC